MSWIASRSLNIDTLVGIGDWAAHQNLGDLLQVVIQRILTISPSYDFTSDSLFSRRLRFFGVYNKLVNLSMANVTQFEELLMVIDDIFETHQNDINLSDWITMRSKVIGQCGVAFLCSYLSIEAIPEDRNDIKAPEGFDLTQYKAGINGLIQKLQLLHSKEGDDEDRGYEMEHRLLTKISSQLCDISTGIAKRIKFSPAKVFDILNDRTLKSFIHEIFVNFHTLEDKVLPEPYLNVSYNGYAADRKTIKEIQETDWSSTQRDSLGPYAETVLKSPMRITCADDLQDSTPLGKLIAARSQFDAKNAQLDPLNECLASQQPLIPLQKGKKSSTGTIKNTTLKDKKTTQRNDEEEDDEEEDEDVENEEDEDDVIITRKKSSATRDNKSTSKNTSKNVSNKNTSRNNGKASSLDSSLKSKEPEVLSKGRNASKHVETPNKKRSLIDILESCSKDASNESAEKRQKSVNEDISSAKTAGKRKNVKLVSKKRVEDYDIEDDIFNSDKNESETENEIHGKEKRHQKLNSTFADIIPSHASSSNVTSSSFSPSRKMSMIEEVATQPQFEDQESVEQQQSRKDGKEKKGSSNNLLQRKRLIDTRPSAEEIDFDSSDESIDFTMGSAVSKLTSLTNKIAERENFPEKLVRSSVSGHLDTFESRGLKLRVRWNVDEEQALINGISRYGAGRWKDILADPEFAPFLQGRSNVNLKDKYRNLVLKGMVE